MSSLAPIQQKPVVGALPVTLDNDKEVAIARDEARPTKALCIRLASGKTLTLDKSSCIFGSDLDAADHEAPMALAQVQRHPTDKSRIGLINLSTRTWNVRSAKGDSTTIPQGTTLALKDGLLIDFGIAAGEVLSLQTGS